MVKNGNGIPRIIKDGLPKKLGKAFDLLLELVERIEGIRLGKRGEMGAALAVEVTGIDEMHLEVKMPSLGLFAGEGRAKPFVEVIPIHGYPL